MKQVEADIVVVGSGAAGLAVAVTAAEGDASVIIFEKASTTGGTSNMGVGPFAVESKYQRQKLIRLTRDEAFKIHMNFTHWRVDARLVKAYIDKSASTIDWLEKFGIEMSDVRPHNPGYAPTWHIIKVPGRDPTELFKAGEFLVKTLTDKAQQMGTRIFFRTTAKKILKERERVVGVLAEDEAAESIQVRAKAVVIATGGFGDSPEMIKKYTGFEWGRDLFTMRIPGLVGDGIRMAWEAGAATSEMAIEFTIGLAMGLSPNRHSIAANTFRQFECLMVNLSGERFMDEAIMMENPSFAGNAVARQKGGCAYSVFDGATAKYWEENGFYFSPAQRGFNLDDEMKRTFIDGPDKLMDKDVFVADSMEELAGKTGINPDALRKALDEYNRCCEKGHDDLFAKDAAYLRTVMQPKFYAGKIIPGGFGSMGGIKINYKTEVLNKELDVIPGLYAAGIDANSIYGDSYLYPMPGNTYGFALNSGRMAGESALKFVKSIAK